MSAEIHLVPERPRGMGRVKQYYLDTKTGIGCRFYQHRRGDWNVSLRGGTIMSCNEKDIAFLREVADAMEKFLEPILEFEI